MNIMGNNQHKDQYVYRNEQGELEVIDLVSGELIVSEVKPPASSYAFDYKKALMVAQEVRLGKTLQQISQQPGMPPLDVIFYWQRNDRMFAEELKAARHDRGHVYHDKVVAISEAAQGASKDDVPGLALALKGYQWAAERNAPQDYGSKVTHEGSTEKPIVMRVINTGISREAKPQIIEVIEKGKEHVQQERESEDSREDEESESENHQ